MGFLIIYGSYRFMEMEKDEFNNNRGEERFVLGIDAAWTSKEPSGVAVQECLPY